MMNTRKIFVDSGPTHLLNNPLKTREIFVDSGPTHLLNNPLTPFNWYSPFHRTSVAASLVQGVYNLEHDRQSFLKHDRHGRSTAHVYDPSSPLWWESFNFQMKEVLKDEEDLSFFGAIYELQLKDVHPGFYIYRPHPPRYVIAFRGTMFKSATRHEDMKLNMKCVFDKLEDSPRFRTAFEMVSNVVQNVGAASVWLAGHSLGAAIALLAGKKMAKSGFLLETYLFNPPFVSVPIEMLLKNETLKLGVRITGSFITAGIAATMNLHHKDPEEDQFYMLSEWAPNVFVNPSDPLCAEYIGYFASHLIPTAYITVNRSEKFKEAHGIHQWWPKFKEAHGIEQWWQDFQWDSKLCKFDEGPSVEERTFVYQNEHHLGYGEYPLQTSQIEA